MSITLGIFCLYTGMRLLLGFMNGFLAGQSVDVKLNMGGVYSKSFRGTYR